jgi:hypothetical protein
MTPFYRSTCVISYWVCRTFHPSDSAELIMSELSQVKTCYTDYSTIDKAAGVDDVATLVRKHASGRDLT